MGYEIILSKVSTKKERQGARFKLRHPDGTAAYPINDCQDAHNAWDLRGRSDISSQRVVAHIKSAARQIPGCHGPWEHEMAAYAEIAAADRQWVTMERLDDGAERELALDEGCVSCDQMIQTFLTLERGDVPGVTILQEGSNDNGGRMRMKVPFYVGGAVSRASGFSHKILWQESVLPAMVPAMKAVIREGRQPLTVYPRHSHALDGAHLPVGALTDVVQEGRIGYAVLEIEPTSEGKDIQVLARGKKLNAVSLRAAPGSYRLELQRVNGEDMLVCEELLPAGIDFAPDGPAQPTFGIELLNEAPRIEPLQSVPPPNEEASPVDLTLEGLRADHAGLVQQLEAPLKAEADRLSKENGDLVKERDGLSEQVTKLTQEKEAAAADAAKMTYVEQLLGQAKSLTAEQKDAVREYAKSVRTKEEVAVKLAEFLIQAQQGQPAAEELTAEQRLQRALFPGSGNGQVGQPVVQDAVNLDVEANIPN